MKFRNASDVPVKVVVKASFTLTSGEATKIDPDDMEIQIRPRCEKDDE